MISLSIIVPIVNEQQIIDRFLAHLMGLEQIEKAEIIVVDGGSTDGSVDIVRRHPVTLIETSRGRARQMNAGALQARGERLLFVHADSRLPADAIAQVLAQADCAGCFRLAFDSDSWVLSSYAWFTRFDINLFRFGDQGLFLSRCLFHESGGFDESLTLMEDQEFVRRLKRIGAFRILPHPVITSARKYEIHGVLLTQLTFTLIVVLFYLGVNQRHLARLYKSVFTSA